MAVQTFPRDLVGNKGKSSDKFHCLHANWEILAHFSHIIKIK